jgi:hypothetical protein
LVGGTEKFATAGRVRGHPEVGQINKRVRALKTHFRGVRERLLEVLLLLLLAVGFGRIVVSEKEVPIILANLV